MPEAQLDGSGMKVAPTYLDAVYRDGTYEGVAWLSSMICGSGDIELSRPTYGLSDALFVIVEGLAWFAQSVRSGSTTYFEATSPDRQQAMLNALRQYAPGDFADQYDKGIRSWRALDDLSYLDRWIERNDERNTALIWQIAQTYRPEIEGHLA
jgi:hypothetical protein